MKEVQRYLVLKQIKKAEHIASQSLSSIFLRQSFEPNSLIINKKNDDYDNRLIVNSLSESSSSDSSEVGSTISGVERGFWDSKHP